MNCIDMDVFGPVKTIWIDIEKSTDFGYNDRFI
jgi:hypothetical protein